IKEGMIPLPDGLLLFDTESLQSLLVDFCFGFPVLCCTYFTNLPLRSLVKRLLYAPHATFEQRIVIASLLQLCRLGAMLLARDGHSPSYGLLRDRFSPF